LLAHSPPTGLCWQTPLTQRAVQQSSLMAQGWPADLVHAHLEPRRISALQLPLQQASVPQALPSLIQQAPPMQGSPAGHAGVQAAVDWQTSPDGA
jgi:hypothetical protein